MHLNEVSGTDIRRGKDGFWRDIMSESSSPKGWVVDVGEIAHRGGFRQFLCVSPHPADSSSSLFSHLLRLHHQLPLVASRLPSFPSQSSHRPRIAPFVTGKTHEATLRAYRTAERGEARASRMGQGVESRNLWRHQRRERADGVSHGGRPVSSISTLFVPPLENLVELTPSLVRPASFTNARTHTSLRLPRTPRRTPQPSSPFERSPPTEGTLRPTSPVPSRRASR